ncbi:Uncharacterized protein BP5553_07875 [Venustampulla echinocandica]|uniref:Alpha/beta-hydrolase n=1 Tax=Venustampulla echinocandica TaxID=2656787 RepID=A0A370THS0_9HELO|nr:Uncharacterized protein BP5553_07875 [Venustampulla echinocandica]RDL34747.1 Uncharacterized protein BP5553_07875 [Venustampulla echinocandica]
MKWIALITAALVTRAAVAQGFSNSGPSNGGSGPYLANYSTDSTLTGHTLFAPKQIPDGLKLPVLVWGEGGCQANGTMFLSLLNEIASYGIFIIASGDPGGTGQTTSKMMTDAINWVSQNAGKGKYVNVDATRIAAAGQSCGGLEAYDMKDDARISALGIFNSGQMTEAASKQIASTITKPIFFFLGGSSDIAYANGERDYKLLPTDTPSWKGNLPVGHSGTYMETDAGKFGVAAVRFLQWTLGGNVTAAEYFTGPSATTDGWSVESKNLNKIKVTSL